MGYGSAPTAADSIALPAESSALNQTRDGLSNPVVRCIFEDAEGSLWVGTAGGVNRFRQYPVTVRTMREGLPSDSFRSVPQDGFGDAWLAPPTGWRA